MQRNYVILVDDIHEVCIDTDFQNELLGYLEGNEKILKKFNYHKEVIAKGIWTKEIFEKESPNSKVEHIYCWKIRVTVKGRKVNDRLICKVIEVNNKRKIIILAGLFKNKKTNKLSQDQIGLMEKVSSYEY